MRSSLLRTSLLAVAFSLTACSAAGGPAQTLPASVDHAQGLALGPVAGALPKVKSITIVIMENRDYDLVIGSPDAPYINKTLVPESALFTNSHAVGHPSQPNYLALFSGSTQGISDDSCPHTFSATNLGAELLAKSGASFDGYSESMPSNGYTGCASGEYARKHNPWVNFTNVPATSNLIYTTFKTPPPTVSFIVPNLCDDMHDCSTQMGDTWLSKNLPAIIKYNAANDGLLVLTWDEADPDANGKNQIATLMVGPMVKPGSYAQDITHYSVLHTIESLTGVKCTANACSAGSINGIWK